MKDLGVITKEPAAEVDDSPCDGRKIPDLRLLERRHYLPESIVELFLLLAGKFVRATEFEDDLAI